jgi:hypothetical protein
VAGGPSAAQASLEPEKWTGLRDFVRQKRRKLQADDGLRVYLYRNRSASGRIASFNGLAFVLMGSKVPPLIASEISWPPLGVVFSRAAHPLLDPMKEITDWGSSHFRERASFSFSVPNYHVEHHFPFAYGRATDAEKWVNSVGAAYLVHEADVENPTTFSALVRPSSRRAL